MSGAKVGAGAGAAFGAAALGAADEAEADGIVRTWPGLSTALSVRPLALTSAVMETFSLRATLKSESPLTTVRLPPGPTGPFAESLVGAGVGRRSEGTAAGAGATADGADATGRAPPEKAAVSPGCSKPLVLRQPLTPTRTAMTQRCTSTTAVTVMMGRMGGVGVGWVGLV